MADAITPTLHSKKADSHLKSFAKAISWRIIATLTTTLISWVITRSLFFAISIGSIELIAKIALYYLHERIWLKI